MFTCGNNKNQKDFVVTGGVHDQSEALTLNIFMLLNAKKTTQQPLKKQCACYSFCTKISKKENMQLPTLFGPDRTNNELRDEGEPTLPSWLLPLPSPHFSVRSV